MSVLNRARKLAAYAGLEITRANPMTVWRKRLPALLEKYQIDLVFDIGANDGGFAAELLDNGYQGKILSFEPLPEAWQALSERARSVAPGRWQVGPRIALGAEDGEIDFYEAGNSVSSSILPMRQEHIDAAPNSAPVRTIKVPIKRLDEILAGTEAKNVYVKIDVQGAEHLVLAGAQESLKGNLKFIQLEMSLASLYGGQKSAKELDDFLKEKGFILWDIIPGFRDEKTFRLMQYDGIYIRA